MSLKPGIGAFAISDVASDMMQRRVENISPDVPVGLRHGSSILPLGRYLRRRLRAEIGRDPAAPPEVMDALRERMRPVFEAASSVVPRGTGGLKNLVVRNAIGDENAQAVRNALAKSKMRKGSL